MYYIENTTKVYLGTIIIPITIRPCVHTRRCQCFIVLLSVICLSPPLRSTYASSAFSPPSQPTYILHHAHWLVWRYLRRQTYHCRILDSGSGLSAPSALLQTPPSHRRRARR